MRNYQIMALTEVLRRSERVVRRGDDGSEIYRRNLELLGGAVERGVRILRARQRQLGGSSLPRTGERPPMDVDVSTWREFVQRIAEARTTWIAACTGNDPAELVNDAESLDGLGDPVVVRVGRVQELTSMLRARAYAVQTQSRISNTAPAFTAALARLNEGLREAATAIGGAPGSTPPTGVTVPIWRDFRGVFAAAQQTATAAQSGSLSTGAPATSPAGATPPASKPAGAQPEQPAAPRRRRASGGGEEIMPAALPQPPATPDQPALPGGGGTGIMSAWSSAFSTLLDPSRTDGMFIDRLQDTIAILNPTGVSIPQRPWFWPAVLGVGGLIGYDYWKKAQAKKPAPKASTKPAPATP